VGSVLALLNGVVEWIAFEQLFLSANKLKTQTVRGPEEGKLFCQ
jgi:hypothetical protein